MAQYKHDRFAKFYLKELYDEIKGSIHSNIDVIAHETLFIDILFDRNEDRKDSSSAWKEQNLGLLDLVMADSQITIVEHYSHYFEKDDFDNCLFRSIGYKLQNKETLNKQEPFTWVITARFSKKMADKCNPIPDSTWRNSLALDLVKSKQGSDSNDLRLREPILRLADIHNLGIVVIERLPLTPETMWLKLLGEEEDCRAAYQMIKDSPLSPQRNATLRACAKFNSYIKNLPKEEITEEDMIIIRSTEEVDKLYAEDYYDILAKGEIKAAKRLIAKKFGSESITPELTSKLEGLTVAELDLFIDKILDFQQLTEVTAWLDDPNSGEANNEELSESEMTL